MFCGLCGDNLNDNETYTYKGIVCCIICYELIDNF